MVRRARAVTLDGSVAMRYPLEAMIKSFKCRETEALFARTRTRRFGPDLQRSARRKLMMLDAAVSLDDLRQPPGNRLEELKGNRRGQWSIRVNDQWRLCFRWVNGVVLDVEMVDYH